MFVDILAMIDVNWKQKFYSYFIITQSTEIKECLSGIS